MRYFLSNCSFKLSVFLWNFIWFNPQKWLTLYKTPLGINIEQLPTFVYITSDTMIFGLTYQTSIFISLFFHSLRVRMQFWSTGPWRAAAVMVVIKPLPYHRVTDRQKVPLSVFRSNTPTSRHVQQDIGGHEELDSLTKDSIAGGGINPHIHKTVNGRKG